MKKNFKNVVEIILIQFTSYLNSSKLNKIRLKEKYYFKSHFMQILKKLFSLFLVGFILVGCNSGKFAGQSILHCHIHLIPRRKGDVENPQGGVRSVIPSMQHYVRKSK